MSHRTSAGLLAVATALALGLTGGANAAPSPAADFGQHVASCAREHLGQRTDAPAVTCTHDGTVMSFENFGAMVEHMRQHHGQ